MEEQLLLEATAALNAHILATLDSASPFEHSFSEKFLRKMRRVIRIGNAPIRYRIQRNLVRAACILILSFLALMMVSPSARAAVVAWIKEQYNIYTKYTYQQERKEVYHQFELTYLPEGYVLATSTTQENLSTKIFTNPQNEKILYFQQTKKSTATEIYFDTAEYAVENITRKGKALTVFLPINHDLATAIVWYDDSSGTLLILSGHEQTNVLIKIAENIKKVKIPVQN